VFSVVQEMNFSTGYNLHVWTSVFTGLIDGFSPKNVTHFNSVSGLDI
jgi:hypothetical protein